MRCTWRSSSTAQPTPSRGPCVYAQAVCFPAGARVGSATVCWPSSRNGRSGNPRADASIVATSAVGWPSPRGGAQRLIDALVGYLAELGGEVRTGALVTAVHASGRRVTGVRLADGEQVAA